METIKQIGKFIAWWWKGLSRSTKLYIPLTIWTLLLIPGLYFFGSLYFIVFFAAFILYYLGVLVRIVYIEIKESWMLFQAEQDRERQRVADKLRGHVSDIYAQRDEKIDRAQEILAKLRAKMTP
jgi:hypothetical protein